MHLLSMGLRLSAQSKHQKLVGMPDEPSAGKCDCDPGLRFGTELRHADLPLRQGNGLALGQNSEWVSAPGITLQGALPLGLITVRSSSVLDG